MEEFWILFLVAFFVTNSLDKAESVKVKLEETPLKTFDEIFGEGWWDKGEAEDLKTPAPTNFGQNVHHQIERQNTQIEQIEPNLTDQNPPLTESDHSVNAKNNKTVSKELGLSFMTISNWKREFGQTTPKHKHSESEQKQLMKRYYEIKYQNPKISDEYIVKRLKIGSRTLRSWKKKFERQQMHPNSVDGHSVEVNAAANVLGVETKSIFEWDSNIGDEAKFNGQLIIPPKAESPSSGWTVTRCARKRNHLVSSNTKAE
uniref:Transposase n=1 Tax=Globodera rostochiensis TaxID=31243 RepID=A0A914HU24_GLORO